MFVRTRDAKPGIDYTLSGAPPRRNVYGVFLLGGGVIWVRKEHAKWRPGLVKRILGAMGDIFFGRRILVILFSKLRRPRRLSDMKITNLRAHQIGRTKRYV